MAPVFDSKVFVNYDSSRAIVTLCGRVRPLSCYRGANTMRNFSLLAIAFALPLAAADHSKDVLSAVHTDHFHLAAPGLISLDDSFGEVDVNGWDRLDVEVTVTRSTEHLYGGKEHADAQRRLDGVQITSRQDGNDVIISTTYPPRRMILHPLSRRSDIEIHYRIQAPRASKLVVDHNNGGVNAYGIDGDIHATVINGQITLTLPAAGKYEIDAQSKLGDVYSDFDGANRTMHVLSEAFAGKSATPAAKLYLRARIGDIMILKLNGPTD
jgi:hypothetical protein